LQVRIRISRFGQPSDELSLEETAASGHQSPADTIAAGQSRIPASASTRVAIGILLTRLSGLVRERVISHYFGNSPVLGVFRAAFKIPNLLSNLFGEGVLSAAFITVYAKLRALGEDGEARHVAAAVFSILSCVCSVLVLLGIASTPFIIDLIAPGFHGAERELTIRLVRILFPAAGVLVLSAWCLGILNSHRKFLLSYTAPIAMNATMIGVLLLFARYLYQTDAVIYLAWGCVVGSLLQFLVQLPSVLELLPDFRPIFDTASKNVRLVIRTFGPIFISRGVVQISSYIDQIIATFLGAVAVSALAYGQILAVLPVSLFSMSVSAAELPELSSVVGAREQVAAQLRKRLAAGLRRIAFFVVPCAVAFLVIGDILIAALLQTGNFHYEETVYVWSVLAGSSVGLLATSLGRLYSSVFYALHDTRTPLRFAVIRVTLTTILGLVFAFPLPRWLGIDPKWGVAGLTTSAGIAGWVEFTLLRYSLSRRIGPVPGSLAYSASLWVTSFAAALFCFWLKTMLGVRHPLPLAVVVIPLYAGIYLGGTALLRVPESKATFVGVLRQLGFG
jgi:putative peptidoglycan lipid II flippase